MATKMAEALQNIGNLWDHLSDLHQKDPEKYKEVIEDSAKGGVALDPFSAKVRIRRSSVNKFFKIFFLFHLLTAWH